MIADWSAEFVGAVRRRFARVSDRNDAPAPDVLSQTTTFLSALTSAKVLARVNELVENNPAWRVLFYMLGPDRLIEYAHTACSSDQELRRSAPPIPPENLRVKVAAPEEPIFLWTGAVDLEVFLRLFDKHGSGVQRPAILDFGCGCGRLTRYFNQADRYQLSASDVNKELVDWCRGNLKNIDTRLNGLLPPLPFGDGSFDYGYSLSIFTHLPEHLAASWLRDVARVIKPDGIFLLTTHGEAALRIIESSTKHQTMFNVTAREAADLPQRWTDERFVYLPYAQRDLHFAQAGPEYGNCFVHPQYVEQTWCSQGWRLLEYIPGGLRRWQDVFVLKNQSSGVPSV